VSRSYIEGCPVRFGLACTLTWDVLDPTEDPRRRYCRGCDSPVFFVDSAEQARIQAAAGNCIVLDSGLERPFETQRFATTGRPEPREE